MSVGESQYCISIGCSSYTTKRKVAVEDPEEKKGLMLTHMKKVSDANAHEKCREQQKHY